MKTNDLRDQVNEILSEYGDKASEALVQAVEETTTEAVQKVKTDSPVHRGPYPASRGRTPGTYKKSWRKKTEKGRLSVSSIIYSNKEYRLTHLLENGHAKRGGGRTAPIPHIRPVEEWANDEVLRKIKEKLE